MRGTLFDILTKSVHIKHNYSLWCVDFSKEVGSLSQLGWVKYA